MAFFNDGPSGLIFDIERKKERKVKERDIQREEREKACYKEQKRKKKQRKRKQASDRVWKRK